MFDMNLDVQPRIPSYLGGFVCATNHADREDVFRVRKARHEVRRIWSIAKTPNCFFQLPVFAYSTSSGLAKVRYNPHVINSTQELPSFIAV
jgi:hypothetical protein